MSKRLEKCLEQISAAAGIQGGAFESLHGKKKTFEMQVEQVVDSKIHRLAVQPTAEVGDKAEEVTPSAISITTEDIIVEPEYKKRVMVDFDKTIFSYSKGWNNGVIDMSIDPMPGANECIKEMKEMGFEIYVYTARLADGNVNKDEQKKMIKEWLNKYEIEVDGITADKMPADLYIDDKAYRFTGNWYGDFPMIKGILEDKRDD